MVWLLALQLWTSLAVPFDSQVLLNGVWQSCREEDGYGERIFEHRLNGRFEWELHMGPYHDFALYTTLQPDDHDHATSDNLLGPNYKATAVKGNSNLVQGEWNVPSLYLHVSAHVAGGSREDCETFIVQVRVR